MSTRIEPTSSVIDGLGAMAEKVYEQTGRHGITRLSLTPEVGLALGIPPGTSVDVATSVGSIEIYCERTPRMHGAFQVDPGDEDRER